MDLCRDLHKDNGLFSFNEEMVLAMIRRAFKDENGQGGGGLASVIDGDGEIAGGLFTLFSHVWYTTDTHIEELFNFVRPKYRKTNYAKQLLVCSKAVQKTIGVPLIIGVLTNKRTEAKVTFYRRHLGKPAGAFFVVGAEWANECEPYDIDVWVKTHDGRGNKRSLGPATMTTTPLPMLPLAKAG